MSQFMKNNNPRADMSARHFRKLITRFDPAKCSSTSQNAACPRIRAVKKRVMELLISSGKIMLMRCNTITEMKRGIRIPRARESRFKDMARRRKKTSQGIMPGNIR